ncbi:hypothetical protein EDC04DRAFT_2737279 [Pisolithus marmoratus]|nr:hypothetical protein EDC04DRAFT_2737279 [Pisolithus marmoratus]
MFGLKYLRNYIGKLTFFARFPWVMDTILPSDIQSVGSEDDSLLLHPPKLFCANCLMRCNLFKANQSNAAQSDPCLQTALPLLYRRCLTLRTTDAKGRFLPRGAYERRKMECELMSMSQTLGTDLLEHIRIRFDKAYYARLSSYGSASHPQSQSTGVTGQASNMYYDRTLNIPSMVQEVQALKTKLNATEDEDEQRALEEDVTGKILWLCWCGICAEVDELLSKASQLFHRHRCHLMWLRLRITFGGKRLHSLVCGDCARL